jgi:2'-5' RNA ligase
MNLPRRESLRLFFALWPEPAMAQRLHALTVDQTRRLGGRAMRPETLHLTLAFLGNVASDRLPAARAAADRVAAASFSFTLDRLEYWRHNRLLWAGGDAAPGLLALAGQLQDSLRQNGFALEERRFVPHVTLARNVKEAQGADLPPLCWECRSFALVRSVPSPDGSVYENVAVWPLGE